MFVIAPHEEGFTVTWPSTQSASAQSLRTELSVAGVPRGREWATGVVVLRYRNELETLKILTDTFTQLAIEFTLDPALASARDAGQAEQNLIDAIRRNAGTRSTPIDARLAEFGTNRTLLGYQREAVAKHLAMANAADFSVPGSGKTTVALAYWTILRRHVPDLGLFIIGPLSCFRPWEEEFEACFGREPNVLRIHGTAQQRQRQLRLAHRHELVLCSYHTSWREVSSLTPVVQRRPWLLVLDEAHYVKSMTGVLAQAVRRLSPHAYRRMILTGTPMPRSPEDIWSLFTFLWPTETLLGNANQHALRCKRPPTAVCRELRTQLAPFFHRTCKDDLELPLIHETYPAIPVQDVPPTQRLLIRLIERRTLEEVPLLRSRDLAHLRRWRRARVIRLLQAASNPLLLAHALDPAQVAAVADDDVDTIPADDPEIIPLDDLDSDLAAALRRYRENQNVPAKAQYVVDRCRELVAQREKVVIWTVFLGNVDLLAKLLDDLNPLCITGEIPPYEAEDDEEGEVTREKRIKIFKSDPNRCVLIANAAACSESISLHKACQHAIYLERSFNAAHFLQSLDRIHRQGMPAGTTAHVEIPYVPCAIERVLNTRLKDRQTQLKLLLNDPMPIVGFDDEAHQGLFDLEDLEGIDDLFAQVLREIRAEHRPKGRRKRGT
jgi:SNF2-related domain